MTSSAAYGGSYGRETTIGPDASLQPAWRSTAYGSTISLYGVKTPSSGKAVVYVDGTAMATVDLYSASTTNRARIFSRTFTRKKHVVELRLTGTRNAKSSGYWAAFDRLTVS